MTELRERFDEAADLYDRARPRYPPALVAELARRTGLGPGSRVLEIAPGTGQLTGALAGYGCRITCVELGASMAAVARRNLAGSPQVDVVVSDFEGWELPAEPFDLVVCATAFHWIDPSVRMVKTARALRPGGRLAVVVTDHVAGGTVEFFARSQRCYERWDPATPPGLRLLPSSETPCDTGEFERSPHYGALTVGRFEQDIDYTTDRYLDVLLTYSNHRALERAARDGLLSCLRELIDGSYGGRVTKRYLHQMIVAVRTEA